LVDPSYVERIISKHGEDSDEYKIRVLGEFPSADAVDERGYVPLLRKSDLIQIKDEGRFGLETRMGIDPAGEGRDLSVWVIRDNFKAKVVATEKKSTIKSIAMKTCALMDLYNIDAHSVFIDNFGIGANIPLEVRNVNQSYMIRGINVGNKAHDAKFINQRAEAFYRLREWLKKGGELVRHDKWDELLNIRYRREEITGKFKIMGKLEMKKMGVRSPNFADSIMLTCLQKEGSYEQIYSDEEVLEMTDVY